MIERRERSREEKRRIKCRRHCYRKTEALDHGRQIGHERYWIVARKLDGVTNLIRSCTTSQTFSQKQHVEVAAL